MLQIIVYRREQKEEANRHFCHLSFLRHCSKWSTQHYRMDGCEGAMSGHGPNIGHKRSRKPSAQGDWHER
jgi:hypothetical protein